MKKEKVKKEKKKKVKVIKAPKIQTIFCIISIIFILGCCGFYGSRLIKYYKVYNPKSETGEALANLSSEIISSSSIVFEGDGLYNNLGNYVYKGRDVNNYLLVSNMMFRIVKINTDKTIDIVLDEYINKLSFNDDVTSYLDSSLNKYLNEKFLPIIDKELLVPTSICTSPVYELSEVNCDTVDNNNYVKILGISEFLNSMNDSKTYLVNDSEYLWLYNHGKENIWHTNGMNVANSKSSNLYGVKPYLTLKNTTVYVTGDGTLENPYQIKEEDKIRVGTYLDINDDIYIVYEEGTDYLQVESNRLLPDKHKFADSSNEYKDSLLKTYLEETYVKKLSYQDILKEVTWFGDIKSTVGILSNDDLKFNSDLEGYFIDLKKDNNISLYNTSVLSTRVNIKRDVRPCLGIKKDLKIISGNGSRLAPFIVEV